MLSRRGVDSGSHAAKKIARVHPLFMSSPRGTARPLAAPLHRRLWNSSDHRHWLPSSAFHQAVSTPASPPDRSTTVPMSPDSGQPCRADERRALPFQECHREIALACALEPLRERPAGAIIVADLDLNRSRCGVNPQTLLRLDAGTEEGQPLRSSSRIPDVPDSIACASTEPVSSQQAAPASSM